MSRTAPRVSLTRGGDVLWLDGSAGVTLTAGAEGFDDPPRSLIMVEPGSLDGSVLVDVRYSAREVFLPLLLTAVDTETLRASTRSLMRLLDPRRGAVTVTAHHHDGSTRTIEGLLSRPLGAGMQPGEAVDWRVVGATLSCPEPFWQDAQQSRSWRKPAQRAFLSPTFLPFQLGQAEVIGVVEIELSGDGAADPVWTVVGPCDAISAAAEVPAAPEGGILAPTSASWSVPGGLAAGEILTIDCRRGALSVTVDGESAWDRLSQGSSLWTLQPGSNTVTIDALGADEDTVVTLSWRERWLSAW